MSYKEKAAGGNPTAIYSRQVYINPKSANPQSNLDKSGLISPSSLLDILGIRYQRFGTRLSVFCPFHKGGKERNPSLSMHPKDGHYKCFTCGGKGGDVIAFYRAVTGAGFAETLKALGVHRG